MHYVSKIITLNSNSILHISIAIMIKFFYKTKQKHILVKKTQMAKSEKVNTKQKSRWGSLRNPDLQIFLKKAKRGTLVLLSVHHKNSPNHWMICWIVHLYNLRKQEVRQALFLFTTSPFSFENNITLFGSPHSSSPAFVILH